MLQWCVRFFSLLLAFALSSCASYPDDRGVLAPPVDLPIACEPSPYRICNDDGCFKVHNRRCAIVCAEVGTQISVCANF